MIPHPAPRSSMLSPGQGQVRTPGSRSHTLLAGQPRVSPLFPGKDSSPTAPRVWDMEIIPRKWPHKQLDQFRHTGYCFQISPAVPCLVQSHSKHRQCLGARPLSSLSVLQAKHTPACGIGSLELRPAVCRSGGVCVGGCDLARGTRCSHIPGGGAVLFPVPVYIHSCSLC